MGSGDETCADLEFFDLEDLACIEDVQDEHMKLPPMVTMSLEANFLLGELVGDPVLVKFLREHPPSSLVSRESPFKKKIKTGDNNSVAFAMAVQVNLCKAVDEEKTVKLDQARFIERIKCLSESGNVGVTLDRTRPLSAFFTFNRYPCFLPGYYDRLCFDMEQEEKMPERVVVANPGCLWKVWPCRVSKLKPFSQSKHIRLSFDEKGMVNEVEPCYAPEYEMKVKEHEVLLQYLWHVIHYEESVDATKVRENLCEINRVFDDVVKMSSYCRFYFSEFQ